MKRADLAVVINPKLGELKIASPVVGSAATVSDVFGPLKFTRFSRLNASARIVKPVRPDSAKRRA